MLSDFKAFLLKQNVIALAIAVLMGAALGNLVTSLVDNFIMPVVGLMLPGERWRTFTWNVGTVKFGVGAFAAAALNFVIIAFVAWRLARMFIKPDPAAPATKTCTYCRMNVDAAATRCAHCTSELARA